MALETVSGQSFKAVGMLQPGEKIEGFLVDVVKEKNKFNSEQWNFVLKNEAGEEFKVTSGGTAKYFASNVAVAMGKEPANPKFLQAVETAKNCLGKWIVMSPDGSYANKTGQTVKVIKIQVDSDKVPSEEIPF